MKYGRVADMSNNSESQVSGDAAENYDQIASLTMLPWAENLVASANLLVGTGESTKVNIRERAGRRKQKACKTPVFAF